MSHITLLYNDPGYLPFCLDWVKPAISDFVKVELYDPNRTYSIKDTLCYVSYVNPSSTWAQHMLDAGFKILVDHLWDSDVDNQSWITDHVMTLQNPNWLWYYSCIEWTHLGHNQYRPDHNYQHAFFMPMNRQEWHRDLILESLKPVLHQALYSYASQGKTLPEDVPTSGQISWRSYFNKTWYDTTRFSVVAESYMRTNYWIANSVDSHVNYKTEVSEKLFKPMMGRHPFIVFGSADTLKYLHREGFESFENLFDESYDGILKDQERHKAASHSVLQAVDNYNNNLISLDSITQQKIKHNHARLFDIRLVKSRVRDEILTKILEFAEQ
jgi:hypothetical protein